MPLQELYSGREVERDVNGINTTVTYYGSKAECDAWAAAQVIGASYAGLGKLATVTVSQGGGSIYHVTARYQNANGTSGSSGSEVVAPDYSFGEFSASMDCQMLSTPLEIHKNASGQFDYKSCWNHFLLAKYPVGGTAPQTPDWWSTLGANASTGLISPIPVADQDVYQWSEGGTLPQETGYKWIVLENPVMAGIQSYDRALYTQTESARFRTRAEAVAAIASYANTVGTPINNPGSPFVDGRWKCDRAQVEWTGDYWRATLTWTYSEDGWNSTLYPL